MNKPLNNNAIDMILLHSLKATFDNKISPSDCANISEYQLGTKTSSTTTWFFWAKEGKQTQQQCKKFAYNVGQSWIFKKENYVDLEQGVEWLVPHWWW